MTIRPCGVPYTVPCLTLAIGRVACGVYMCGFDDSPDTLKQFTSISVSSGNNLKAFQGSLPKPPCLGYELQFGFTYDWPPVVVYNCSGLKGTFPVTISASFESADCKADLGPYLR